MTAFLVTLGVVFLIVWSYLLHLLRDSPNPPAVRDALIGTFLGAVTVIAVSPFVVILLTLVGLFLLFTDDKTKES